MKGEYETLKGVVKECNMSMIDVMAFTNLLANELKENGSIEQANELKKMGADFIFQCNAYYAYIKSIEDWFDNNG